MGAPGFYIKEADISWIRKLCTRLKQTSINYTNPELVGWRCIRELTDRSDRQQRQLDDQLKRIKAAEDENRSLTSELNQIKSSRK